MTRSPSVEAYAARVAKRMYAAKKLAVKKREDARRMRRFTKQLPHWISTKSGRRCVKFVPGAGLRVVPAAECRRLLKAVAQYYSLLAQRARERGTKLRYMPPKLRYMPPFADNSECASRRMVSFGAPELIAEYNADGTINVPRHHA